jgi:hypothetical protein
MSWGAILDNARLIRADLPELYKVASASSAVGQRRVVRLTTLLLGASLGSGIFALFGGRGGPSWHSGADFMAALCFAAAAVGGTLLSNRRPHFQWYDGRAAAESAKTLSWKYAMRAAPFVDDVTADDRFVERLAGIRAVIGQFATAELALLEPDASISPAMRRLRKAPLAARRAAYHHFRIHDQIEWYAAKVVEAERKARAWQMLTVILGIAGVTGAIARALGLFDLDALGLAAAFLASIAAWTELHQYWPNAAAYRLTLRELRIIDAQVPAIAEDDVTWGAFCERAEYAISREHTMWRARAR